VSSGIRNYVITARDYSYNGLPLHAPAGWLTMRLVNAGTEMHMLGVLAVPAKYTPAEMMDSVVHMHLPNNLVAWGGVNNISPGDTGTVSAYFPAGQYVAACFVKAADGTYHVQKGMAGVFDVVAAKDTGSSGQVDATATVSENSVRLSPASLRTGVRNIRVVGSTDAGADLAILRLLPARSVEDAIKWLASPATVAPAAVAIGGPSGIERRHVSVATLSLTPGTYVMLLQPYDAKPGAPAVYRRFTVTAR
jgi:hypothetical protein